MHRGRAEQLGGGHEDESGPFNRYPASALVSWGHCVLYYGFVYLLRICVKGQLWTYWFRERCRNIHRLPRQQKHCLLTLGRLIWTKMNKRLRFSEAVSATCPSRDILVLVNVEFCSDSLIFRLGKVQTDLTSSKQFSTLGRFVTAFWFWFITRLAWIWILELQVKGLFYQHLL